MKRFILLVCLVFIGVRTQAQTFGEWFRQKKTQRQYLIQQIAALQVYIGYAKKGYEIGKDGLNLIGDIKEGDFSLNKTYFASLTTVNPEIKKYSRIKNCFYLQEKITSVQDKTLRQLKESKMLTPSETNYCEGVLKRLVAQSDDTISSLRLITEDGNFSLKDDERLQRINAMYEDMADKYEFALSFSHNALALVRSRYKDYEELSDNRILNALK